MDPLLYVNGLSETNKLLFLSEFNQRRKDRTVALLLTLFLGGFGAHRFYLGQIGLGVLYLLFCWTLLPALVALLELFVVMGRVDRFNDRAAAEIVARLNGIELAPAVRPDRVVVHDLP